MRSAIAFLSCIFVGLATCVPVTPQVAPRILETGYFDPNSTLVRRAIPTECSFGGRTMGPYSYSQYDLGNGDTACIGWSTSITCGLGSWPAQEYTDIVNAMGQQVTKDGQFQVSSIGHWDISFYPGTTAIPNRETYFNLFLVGVDFHPPLRKERSRQYYFSNNFQYTGIFCTKYLC